jgi:hypothetical protein
MKPKKGTGWLVIRVARYSLAHWGWVRRGLFGSIVGQAHDHSDRWTLHTYNMEAAVREDVCLPSVVGKLRGLQRKAAEATGPPRKETFRFAKIATTHGAQSHTQLRYDLTAEVHVIVDAVSYRHKTQVAFPFDLRGSLHDRKPYTYQTVRDGCGISLIRMFWKLSTSFTRFSVWGQR